MPAEINDHAAELDQALGLDCEVVRITEPNSKDVRTVTIRPLRLKHFSEVLKCINDLANAGISLDTGIDSMKLLMTGGDVAIKLIAIASGEPVATIEQLELDEAAELAGAIWRVNKSFFEKKTATMLEAFGVSREKAQEYSDGLKSLLSSSATATA